MAQNSTDFKAVILAGGSGERFWPLSTSEKPKQFLDIFGGKSLIAQSVSRLGKVVKPENVYVITANHLVSLTRKELKGIPKKNIIGEPMRRDTGAAVALGVKTAGKGVIAFFPADQLVTNVKAFQVSLKEAVKKAEAVDTIVTLGIKPTRPATEFGYIDPKAGKFVEKPDAKKAKALVKRGCLWNAGMFIARSEVFKSAFAKFAPELKDVSLKDYPNLKRISFDYAVMEKLPRVEVVASDCGWDDVGGYGALAKYHPELVDAEGNLVKSVAQEIKLLGVKNLIVVATAKGILVAEKSKIGDIKRLFAK